MIKYDFYVALLQNSMFHTVLYAYILIAYRLMNSHTLFSSLLASDTSGETSNTSAKTQISIEHESIGLTKIIEGINLSDTKNSTKREPVSSEDICPVREVPIRSESGKFEPKLEPGELEPTPERAQHPGDILFRAEIEDRPTTPVSTRAIPPSTQAGRDFSFPSQPNMSMSDSIFMNDSAALKQLEADEADFEESNRFKLDKSEFSTVNDSMMDKTNGSDVSAFFRRSSASLGIGITDSPQKDLRTAHVPIEYGGASETFDILPDAESEKTKTNEISVDERRDTVATIKSMSSTFFEPTQTNWKQFHEDLKAAGADQSTISSFCLKNIEVRHFSKLPV